MEKSHNTTPAPVAASDLCGGLGEAALPGGTPAAPAPVAASDLCGGLGEAALPGGTPAAPVPVAASDLCGGLAEAALPAGPDAQPAAVAAPAATTPLSCKIPAMAFVGKKNSGKTTLLVRLVEELTGRGLRVGTVKHHGHVGFDFDVEGRDSWRHRQAGSVFTVVASPDQVASSRALEAEVPLESLIAEMEASARNAQGECLLDVILVEGYRQGKLPTVELFRAENPRDAERELGGEGNRIVAVVTDMPRIVSAAAAQGLPAFGFSDIGDLASFTLASLGVAGHVGEGAESSQQQAGSEPAPQAAATAAPDQRQTDCNPAPQAAAATEPGQQQAGSEPALRGDPKEVQAQCR